MSCGIQDMPGVPLASIYNTECKDTPERTKLSLIGRYESLDKINRDFVMDLADLPLAKQRKVMVRFTDRAIAKLKELVEKVNLSLSKKDRLQALIAEYWEPENRIIKSFRTVALQQQNSNFVKVIIGANPPSEWGDYYLYPNRERKIKGDNFFGTGYRSMVRAALGDLIKYGYVTEETTIFLQKAIKDIPLTYVKELGDYLIKGTLAIIDSKSENPETKIKAIKYIRTIKKSYLDELKDRLKDMDNFIEEARQKGRYGQEQRYKGWKKTLLESHGNFQQNLKRLSEDASQPQTVRDEAEKAFMELNILP